ncbi:MAG TPA: UvrD-helicase domain-containing protein, partial [Mycobacteriales bacterium]|nr:UvrD-helicase domain-containing protein [Mycobacteriales bacterium]
MPTPRFYADLHIHSKYSRACSRDCNLENLAWWAQRKGVTLVGTGDFTHPAWFDHLRQTLVPAEPGLYRLNDELNRDIERRTPPECRAPVRFMLSVEISTIYKQGDKTRKVHHLVYLPDLEAAARFNRVLAGIGNIASDGRPILGLNSRDLLEIALETSPDGYLIPAHIWTPWFAALGSKSGFDAIADCYGDLADHVFAVETGLSSDPAMNWRVSSLDRYTLVSNSDAHSPPALAREATTFATELDYFRIADALRRNDGGVGTVEFFPEEGKYHLDGHRACRTRLSPGETKHSGGLCPVCGKPVTVGVLHRIDDLADRPEGEHPARAGQFTNLIPLPEIIGEIVGKGPKTKTVTREIDRLVAALGPELGLLTEVPVDRIAKVGGELAGEAISRLRRGEVIRQSGYDGEYGVIRLFEPNELDSGALFDVPAMPTANAMETEVADASTTPSSPAFCEETSPAFSHKRSEGVSEPKPDLRSGLDPEQLAAVESEAKQLVIVAGPGTGKTRTLTHRIAHLIQRREVPPEKV